MKVKIVTVFKSNNCGSFLQAWALQQQLSETGHHVSFVDYKLEDSALKSTSVILLKCCLRLRFKRAASFRKKWADFRKYQKLLPVSDVKSPADICFFGSDTLWNFQDKFFSRKAAFFTGAELKCPCYTYAISAGSTSKDVFLKHPEAIRNIQKFKGLAVRDEHTQCVLEETCSVQKTVKTVDPTLLVDKETYVKHFAKSKPDSKKTLVIYYFGVIPEDVWKALCDFARKKNLEIIDIAPYGERAATSVVASPGNFISAFSNAEYIFTNTFHGCVFSAIFNKQFATNGIQKKKIECFLADFALTDRVVSTGDDVEKVFTTPVDYGVVNELISEGRQRSVAYLNDCLREVEKNG